MTHPNQHKYWNILLLDFHYHSTHIKFQKLNSFLSIQLKRFSSQFHRHFYIHEHNYFLFVNIIVKSFHLSYVICNSVFHPFLETICLFITLMSEVYNKRNMDFTKLTHSKLFTLIKEQKTSLFYLKAGPIHPSDERIKEAQADINKMLDALKFATMTTPFTAQKTNDYGLIMQQQSLHDVIGLKKPSIMEMT